MDISAFLKFDRNHIWHPYTSAIEKNNNLFVKNAKGVYLYISNKNKVIDGISSWWSAIHGYNHPDLNTAIIKQLKKMSHVMFGGLTHAPAILLAEKLIKIAPKNLSHVFFTDSGSVAVEVAMKMAIQYWTAKRKYLKQKFITIKNGYHGDTWHAMSVCDPDSGMHQIFKNQLPKQIFFPSFPIEFNTNTVEKLKQLLEKEHHHLAGFILEPIVQGAGGMKFYHPGYLSEVRKLCNEYDILLILDEIATGFGRTGKLFASEYAQISPDIMCVGKALTGGYLTLGASLCNHDIAKTISNEAPNILLHGPTFIGNPLACAVAVASINLLFKNNWHNNVTRIENHLKNSLIKLQNHSAIKDIRVLGAIGVIEMREKVDIHKFQQNLIKHKIWLRPFNNLIYTMPPYIISNKELNILTNGICSSIYETYGNH